MRKLVITIALLGGVGFLFWHFYRQYQLLWDYEYKVKGAKFPVKSLDHVVMDLTLNITNKSTFEITVNSYTFDININGQYIMTAKGNTDQVIGSKQTSPFTITVDFNPKQLEKDLASINFVKNLSFDRSKIIIELNGTISASLGNVPVAKDFPVNIKESLAEMMS
jgi:LEA14-like dessication related protein